MEHYRTEHKDAKENHLNSNATTNGNQDSRDVRYDLRLHKLLSTAGLQNGADNITADGDHGGSGENYRLEKDEYDLDYVWVFGGYVSVREDSSSKTQKGNYSSSLVSGGVCKMTMGLTKDSDHNLRAESLSGDDGSLGMQPSDYEKWNREHDGGHARRDVEFVEVRSID
ncbi:hypothetical protein N7507_010209 [Penicillium longicatenatum]|nr:hypothetical protein N7507_010209 [Penicillium longicatenatum]